MVKLEGTENNQRGVFFMKKFVGIAAIALAMTSLAACSNKTAQPKSSTAKSSQVAKKTANIVGTYQDSKKAAILFKKDGTGRYVSRKDDLDAEFTWKRKNSSTYTLTINDRKNNHEFTAKLAKDKLTLQTDSQTESFSRVTGTKLNLDDFLDKNKSSANQKVSQNSDSETKSTVAGDEGLFDIPADLQGTWYSGDNVDKGDTTINTITIDKHTISYKNKDESGTTITHKMAKDFDYSKYMQNQAYLKATKNWSRAAMINYRGHNVLHLFTWMQGAGAGSYYYLTQEEGQTVLVNAFGAGMWAGGVYWKDEAFAKKYANKSFSDIPTQESDANQSNTTDDDSDD